VFLILERIFIFLDVNPVIHSESGVAEKEDNES